MPKIIQSKSGFWLIAFSLCFISLILFNTIDSPANPTKTQKLAKAPEKDGDNAEKPAVPETYQVEIRTLGVDTNPGAQIRPHCLGLKLHCGQNIQRIELRGFPVKKTFTWSPGKCEDVIIYLGIGKMTLKKVYSGPSGFAKFLSAFSTSRRLFRIDEFDEFDSKALKRLGIEFITIRYGFSGDIQQIIQYSDS